MEDEETEEHVPHTLVSLYSRPDQDMPEGSFHTLWACGYRGNVNLRVIKLFEIISVVSMQPLPRLPNELEMWFVVEKSGMVDVELTGYVEPLEIGVQDGVD